MGATKYARLYDGATPLQRIFTILNDLELFVESKALVGLVSLSPSGQLLPLRVEVERLDH
jgi:hypothetical protein